MKDTGLNLLQFVKNRVSEDTEKLRQLKKNIQNRFKPDDQIGNPRNFIEQIANVVSPVSSRSIPEYIQDTLREKVGSKLLENYSEIAKRSAEKAFGSEVDPMNLTIFHKGDVFEDDSRAAEKINLEIKFKDDRLLEFKIEPVIIEHRSPRSQFTAREEYMPLTSDFTSKDMENLLYKDSISKYLKNRLQLNDAALNVRELIEDLKQSQANPNHKISKYIAILNFEDDNLELADGENISLNQGTLYINEDDPNMVYFDIETKREIGNIVFPKKMELEFPVTFLDKCLS